jgi:hypothetical protein
MQHIEQKTKYANNIEPTTSNSPPQSPIRAQISALMGQLDKMENQIGLLIDSTRDVSASDPRHEPICERKITPVSCALEGGLADISRRLEDQIDIMAELNRNIQL